MQLTEQQAEALRRLAADRRQSIAGVIRAAVDREISEAGESDAHARALEVVGRYRAGAVDMSRDHDRYLDEAYGG